MYLYTVCVPYVYVIMYITYVNNVSIYPIPPGSYVVYNVHVRICHVCLVCPYCMSMYHVCHNPPAARRDTSWYDISCIQCIALCAPVRVNDHDVCGYHGGDMLWSQHGARRRIRRIPTWRHPPVWRPVWCPKYPFCHKEEHPGRYARGVPI